MSDTSHGAPSVSVVGTATVSSLTHLPVGIICCSSNLSKPQEDHVTLLLKALQGSPMAPEQKHKLCGKAATAHVIPSDVL